MQTIEQALSCARRWTLATIVAGLVMVAALPLMAQRGGRGGGATRRPISCRAMRRTAKRCSSPTNASTVTASARQARGWTGSVQRRRGPVGEQLELSMVAPDDEVQPEHRFVRVVTKGGATVTGRLLNQDAFSVQLMNSKEELKSYPRSTLREVTILDKGLMPSYRTSSRRRRSRTSSAIWRRCAASGARRRARAPRGERVGMYRSPTIQKEVGPMKTRLLVVLLCTLGGSAVGAGDLRSRAARRSRAAELADVRRRYSSQRYSALTNITRDNVKGLSLKWVWRLEVSRQDGDDAARGRRRDVCGPEQRRGRDRRGQRPDLLDVSFRRRSEIERVPDGVQGARHVRRPAVLGHLRRPSDRDPDAKSGKAVWNKTVLDYKTGLQFNVAPLVVKDKVILGPATNEFGTNCWIAAFDVPTGNEVWRFKTVPEPGEKGNETWPGDSWQHGGAPIWVTGSYDPDTNLTFWGTGNPNPGWNGGPRNPGDNLYGDSVVALDVDTGKLKWHYQFTPNDEFDWDSVQVPVLADLEWQGRPRKVMLWANRNGFYYALDRVSGQFLMGKAFVKQNWNLGFDNGRPTRAPGITPTPDGTLVMPGTQGGTNWYSPSFSPHTGLFYISVWDNYAAISRQGDVPPWQPYPRKYTGNTGRATGRGPTVSRAGAAYRTEEEGYGAVRAIDPKTVRRNGTSRWWTTPKAGS